MREDFGRMLERVATRLAGGGLLLAVVMFLVLPAQAASSADEPLAILTIVDGPAQLLRDDKRLRAEEGLRLLSQDIVETAADARVTRIEFLDGLAFNLGPSTRVLVDPQFYGERGRFARLYLLGGWIKLKAGAAPAAETKATAAKPIPLLASPAIDVIDASGSLVAKVDDSAVALFVESGNATIHERRDAKPVGAHRAINSGRFLNRSQQGKSTVAGRPAPDFIGAMPRSFLDTLPDRAEIFKNRQPTPREIGAITYDDAGDWLAVEWTLRRPAMKRWRPLTRDPEFRKGLTANMSAHPEWDRLLYPEKYRQRR